MMIPQIIILAFMMISLGAHIARHGEPTDIKYNGIGKLIMIIVNVSILYWGGFFDV